MGGVIDGEDSLRTICHTAVPVTPPPQALMKPFCSQCRGTKITDDLR
ncbi:unnamed protein product [Ectocarpus sp. 13 AM-2016]